VKEGEGSENRPLSTGLGGLERARKEKKRKKKGGNRHSSSTKKKGKKKWRSAVSWTNLEKRTGAGGEITPSAKGGRGKEGGGGRQPPLRNDKSYLENWEEEKEGKADYHLPFISREVEKREKK